MPTAMPALAQGLHRRRWLLVIAALVLAGVVGLLVLLPYVISLDRVRGPIIAQVEAALRRKVEVGNVRLQIFSGLGVGLKDLTISNPPGWSRQHIITAETLSVKIAWWPLLQRRLEITTLQLRDGEIWFERDAQGRTNVDDLAASPSPTTQAAPTAPALTSSRDAPASHPLARLLVSNLELRDMNVTVVDRRLAPGRETTLSVSDVQLTLQDIAAGRPIPIEGTATLLADRRDNMRLRGTIGPVPASLATERLPVEVHIQAAEILLGKLAPYLGPALPLIGGQLSADLTLQGRMDQRLRLNGHLSLAQVEMRQNAGQGTPAPFPTLTSTYDLSLDLAQQRAELTNVRATLLNLEMTLKGAIEQLMTRPHVDLQLATNTFAPGDLLTQAPALKVFLPMPIDVRGNVQLQAVLKGAASDLRAEAQAELQGVALRSGALHGSPPETDGIRLEADRAQAALTLQLAAMQPPSLDVDVRVQRGSLDFPRHTPATAGKAAPTRRASPESVRPTPSAPAPSAPAPLPPMALRGKISIAEGHLQRVTAQRLSADFSLLNGQLTSTHQVHLYGGSYQGTAQVDLTQREPVFGLDGKVAELDVGQALAVLAPDRRTLRGILSTDLHATGSGWDWEAIIQTLDAHGYATIAQATLVHLDPLPELARALQKLGERAGLSIDTQFDRDPFKRIEGDWRLHQGRIMTERLRLRGEGVEAVLDGSVGLDQSIDYTGKVFVPPKFVALRGRPSLLPQDDQGRLALPFTVQGTLMAPRVAVPEKALLGLVREDLLEKLRKRTGGRLEGLLGGPPSGGEPPQRQPDQATPEPENQPKRPNLPRRLLEEFLRR
jgi:AsmA protein